MAKDPQKEAAKAAALTDIATALELDDATMLAGAVAKAVVANNPKLAPYQLAINLGISKVLTAPQGAASPWYLRILGF